ncbi:hypothetical protein ACIBSW_16980 [Actinoplanes sp. NPDC049668]|uniref:hypothetical protein n=1 Tax=unclassified Actinoplanes TaxID=2626549 RepID=UPI00339FAE1A
MSSHWGGCASDVKITCLGDPVSTWRLTFAFAGGECAGNVWNGALTQSSQPPGVRRIHRHQLRQRHPGERVAVRRAGWPVPQPAGQLPELSRRRARTTTSHSGSPPGISARDRTRGPSYEFK